MNFHKQKLYALVAAGVAFVALLLPWLSINFMGYSSSANGFRGWGILSFLGVISVILLTLAGNRPEDYTADFRKYVLYAFGAIVLGALLFLVRKNTMGGGALASVDTGVGLWICLVAGLGGLALLYGLIKAEHHHTPT